jgi:hypothetical protein
MICIENIQELFLEIISKKYNLSENELKRKYISKNREICSIALKQKENDISILKKKKNHLLKSEKELKKYNIINKMDQYKKLSKKDLIEKCKEKNVNSYGTKFELIQRLLVKDKNGVIQEIKHTIPPIYIQKKNDMYIHEDTQFVFDITDKKVIGKWNDNKIHLLSYDDIQLCLKYKFKYELPENLSFSISKKNQTDDVFLKRLHEIQNEKENDDDNDNDEEEENEL